jgi:hypothetical protein
MPIATRQDRRLTISFITADIAGAVELALTGAMDRQSSTSATTRRPPSTRWPDLPACLLSRQRSP